VTDPAPTVADSMLDPEVAALLKRDSAGLVTAVIQEDRTGEVLMVGWMDDVALHKTLTTGRSTFLSRSRGEYWVKGETSGHRQWVREVRLDCDGDTVLIKVHQEGAACHTGDRTCFDRRLLSAVVVDQTEEPRR
jgi:phosphoribosyl-AMP cyclohydrolase